MKIEDKNLNIPNITVSELIKTLSLLYSNTIISNSPLNKIPTPFLWGAPGVGKSEAIAELAKELEKTTGRTVTVTDIRLLLFSPVDLRGVPVADEHRKFSNWLMPKIFDMNPDDDHINILFLDELSAASQSVQAAAYQICLDRKIGEHKLPKNCITIGAGNRTTDQSVSYKMPKALCNRLMHFNIETNYKAWLEWAIAHDIDGRIIGYLAFDNSKLSVEPDSSDMAYPTPRSWAFVSSLIKAASDNAIDALHPIISACIGTDTALCFETWVKSHDDLPCVDEIFNGSCKKFPKTHDALICFISSITCAVHARREVLTANELENMCAYVNKFPADFAFTLYNDLNSIEDIRLKLTKSPSCKAWFLKNKKFI